MEYYHGTDIESVLKIIESGFIGTEYYDGLGFYVSEDIHTASMFGNYILVFEDLYESNLISNDVNLGIFHAGIVDFSNIKRIDISITTENLIKDLYKISNLNALL